MSNVNIKERDDNHIFNIANYIIANCPVITNMKLQKLMYYAQAQYLIENNGEALFDEVIEAWVYGPVIREVYMEFSKYTYKNIYKTNIIAPKELNTNEKKAINHVINLYKDMSAGDLSDKTHCEEPWQNAYSSNDWSENVITRAALMDYYKNNPII